MLDDALLQTLKQELEQRREELLIRLDRGLSATEQLNLGELAGGVGDISDEAVAELAAAGRLAGMQSETEELADTETALQRLREGSYGNCIACGEPIAEERLRVYPTAKRCLRCQEDYERKGRSPTDLTPSL
jgi:RNA polymerase-binding transcription factor DksA